MEIYGTGKNLDGDLEIQWEAYAYNTFKDIEMQPKFLEKITLPNNQIDESRLRFELDRAIREAQVNALRQSQKYLIGKYNNDLAKYLEDFLNYHQTQLVKKTTWEELQTHSREMELDQLMYEHRVDSEEELKAKLSAEEVKRLKL